MRARALAPSITPALTEAAPVRHRAACGPFTAVLHWRHPALFQDTVPQPDPSRLGARHLQPPTMPGSPQHRHRQPPAAAAPPSPLGEREARKHPGAWQGRCKQGRAGGRTGSSSPSPTLMTSPPSTFISFCRFPARRLGFDRHFSSPSRLTVWGQGVGQLGLCSPPGSALRCPQPHRCPPTRAMWQGLSSLPATPSPPAPWGGTGGTFTGGHTAPP